MPDNGTKVTDYATIRDLVNDKKGEKDKRAYFYILKMPDCGGNRIKVGKSSNIYARFKYYQEHFHKSTVQIKELRVFNNILLDRYTDKAVKLYSLFEKEAIYALRDLNDERTKTGLGVLTEWFEPKFEFRLMKKFAKFVEEFRTMKFDKTIKRKGLRSKNNENLSDEESENEETEVYNKPVRTRNTVKRYNPSKGD